jgi:hypothetical protein
MWRFRRVSNTGVTELLLLAPLALFGSWAMIKNLLWIVNKPPQQSAVNKKSKEDATDSTDKKRQ